MQVAGAAWTLALHGRGLRIGRVGVARVGSGPGAAATTTTATLGRQRAVVAAVSRCNGRCRVGMVAHGRTGRCRAVRVGALVGRSFEEIVLQRVVRSDPRLRVVVQHAQDQVLELQVVGHKMTRFTRTTTSRSAGFHTCKHFDIPNNKNINISQ